MSEMEIMLIEGLASRAAKIEAEREAELTILRAEVARLAGENSRLTNGQDWLLRQVQHHCPPGIICRDGQSCLDCWREELRLAVGELAREKGEKQMENPRVLTCVYCGHQYPQDTPAWGNDVLTEHIKVCSKHPMRKAEETIGKLRKALSDLVGADDAESLKQMEVAIRMLPIPEQDRAASLNAIHVLLELA